MEKKQKTFFSCTADAAADPALARKLANATLRQFAARIEICGDFPDLDGMRDLGVRIRDNVLANLEHYLRQFTDNLTAAGVHVHFADTAADARRIIGDIARQNNVRRIVKSKSMASEEIDLNPGLEQLGAEVTETDLGEYIVQLAGHKPSHLVAPAIHFSTQDVADLFREKLNYDGPVDPTAMTKFARTVLRGKFRAAEMGISGVNLGVADPGLISICTNEGNGRYVTTWPKIYVALMGMERLVPDLESAAVILKLLGRFSTGQRITQYTTFTRGPAAADGPRQVHLVLLDNGRSEILKTRYWRILRCIRCGSCLNGCPVFRKIGGHAYGGPYSGPLGMVLLPLLYGLDKYPETPKGSTLCGLCHEVCPMKMPIPDMLLELRGDLARARHTPALERWAMKLWAYGLVHPRLYRMAQRVLPWALWPLARNGWVKFLPGPSGGWTKIKDLPLPATRSFLRSLGAEK